MITGAVTAVAPSGDRRTVPLHRLHRAFLTVLEHRADGGLVVCRHREAESSSAGSVDPHPAAAAELPARRESGGDTAPPPYLASLLAASITGRAPEGAAARRRSPPSACRCSSPTGVRCRLHGAGALREEHAVDVKS